MKFYLTTENKTNISHFSSCIIEGENWDVAWNEYQSKHADEDYIGCIDICNSFEELKKMSTERYVEKFDINKFAKILKYFENHLINHDNFWSIICKLTKNVKSDHTIKRWQCIADWFYIQLNGNY